MTLELRLYDSFARAKRVFEPLDPKNVRLYVCGPTVYDRAHIGNARPVIVFDVLTRLLRHVYGADHVRYARNITDIDDKIMARAAESGRSIEEITAQTTAWYHADMAALGNLPPDIEPRATDHVPQMVGMIAALIEQGAAYEAEGHVLFSVTARDDYGALSRRSLDEMIAGARVDVAPYKRDPMDFVLWKPSADDAPGWDSPWGRGRPGWHIECSAMSAEHLGVDFDIHGGGVDLTFPHHENERAQSLCAHPGSGFARYWMHNGFVTVDGKKMSKSLGNFITVRDLADRIPGEAIRLAMLSTHYRQPFDWTDALGLEAKATLEKWRKLTASAEPSATPPETALAALADDLNTPLAIAALHGLAAEGDGAGLLAGARLLGLLTPELGAWAAPRALGTHADAQVRALLEARAAARGARDFARSDAIRAALDAAGVVVMDVKGAPSKFRLADTFDAAALERAVEEFGA